MTGTVKCTGGTGVWERHIPSVGITLKIKKLFTPRHFIMKFQNTGDKGKMVNISREEETRLYWKDQDSSSNELLNNKATCYLGGEMSSSLWFCTQPNHPVGEQSQDIFRYARTKKLTFAGCTPQKWGREIKKKTRDPGNKSSNTRRKVRKLAGWWEGNTTVSSRSANPDAWRPLEGTPLCEGSGVRRNGWEIPWWDSVGRSLIVVSGLGTS